MPFADDEDKPFDIYSEVLYNFTDQPACDGFEDNIKVFTQPLLQRQPGDRPTFQELAMDLFLQGDFQALSAPSILELNDSLYGMANR